MSVLPLGPKLMQGANGSTFFWCPGCNQAHMIYIERSNHPVWSFNGNLEAPSFQPSVLVRSGHYVPGWEAKDCWCTYKERHGEEASFDCFQCHTFITDGAIQFLSDCSHSLAGQTVPLPDFPEGHF